MTLARDHGGGIDAATRKFGGAREDWLDLSTGINPRPYPVPPLPDMAWTALPDQAAFASLYAAARQFWNVPDGVAIIGAAGASALIAALPRIAVCGQVFIPAPTYNEHAAAFLASGWSIGSNDTDAMVVVHPNNPDGRLWQPNELTTGLTIIDESFCDVMPDQSLVRLAARPGTIILKSFGKFWGLAGLRLGFAIGDPAIIAKLGDLLGPWQVSGPALATGTAALRDHGWADKTRTALAADADRLDGLMSGTGAEVVGGTSLFRLYRVRRAQAFHDQLARHRVLSRIFPYNEDWLRLGLPAQDRWAQLETAL